LIELYNQSADDSVKRNTDYYSFGEINMSIHQNFVEADKTMRAITEKVYSSYAEKIDAKFLPKEYGYEQHRIKKYEPNGVDQFDWHADVGDYQSARRYVVMFYYLNDVAEGGDTLFDLGGESLYGVKPKAGRVVCFPPTFMYPHKGAMPISGPKYIISTYSHYL